MSASDAPVDRPDWPFDGHLGKPIAKTSLQSAIDVPGPAAVAMR